MVSVSLIGGGVCVPAPGSWAASRGAWPVHHVEDAAQAKNFTFKCHRDGTDIFARQRHRVPPAVRAHSSPLPCPSKAPVNFPFKCHRDGTDIFAVNAIAFHPQCAARIRRPCHAPVEETVPFPCPSQRASPLPLPL